MEILDKLEAIKQRWKDLEGQMSEPSAMADMKICPAKQRLQRGGTEKRKTGRRDKIELSS